MAMVHKMVIFQNQEYSLHHGKKGIKIKPKEVSVPSWRATTRYLKYKMVEKTEKNSFLPQYTKITDKIEKASQILR